MFLFQSAFYTLRKYADFKSRASRSEFWCFFAFVIIAQAVAGFVGLLFRSGPALANLLLLCLREGRNIPNRYGGSPKAFSFAG